MRRELISKILKAVHYAVLYIILALMFAAIFSACNPLSVDPLAVYTIDKGSHESYTYDYYNRKRTKIIAPILITGNRLDFGFTFNEGHKYDYTVKDGGDINKLYGITSPKIHQNSARFGWRYIGDDNFEVFTYSYVRGVRSFELIYTAEINEPLILSIDVSGKQYTYGVNGNWFHVYGTRNMAAFRSFPYFGGNNVAPSKMYFKIIEL